MLLLLMLRWGDIMRIIARFFGIGGLIDIFQIGIGFLIGMSRLARRCRRAWWWLSWWFCGGGGGGVVCARPRCRRRHGGFYVFLRCLSDFF